MAGKSVRLVCGPQTCEQLCEALRAYAHAAFPPGGSECAQASRDSLLTLAQRFAAEQATEGWIEVRTRQRALLRSAVTTYFDQLTDLPEAMAVRRRERLLGLLRGEAVTDDAPDSDPGA